MTDLSTKKEDPRYLIVIKDFLLKGIILEAILSMKVEESAEPFMHYHYRFHGFPSAITSYRNFNWAGEFWRALCKSVSVE